MTKCTKLGLVALFAVAVLAVAGCSFPQDDDRDNTVIATVALSDGTAGDNIVMLTLSGTTWKNTPWTDADQKDLKDWFIYTAPNSAITANAERTGDTVLTVTFSTSTGMEYDGTVVIKPGQTGNVTGLGSMAEWFKDDNGYLEAPKLGTNTPVRISIPEIPTPENPTPTATNAQTPTITVHPQGADYNPGATATPLSVSASITDGGTLSYQWYSNTGDSNSGGTIISGATEESWTPPTAAEGILYY